MFSSNKFHKSYTLMCCRDPALLMPPQLLHTRQTIFAMLSSKYIAATHNTTHSPCTSTCTTHPALPTPLPSTTLLCTQLTQGTVGKMAQTVEMVKVLWCHSHLVWLVFEGSIPTCTCFHFFVTLLPVVEIYTPDSAMHSLRSQLLSQGFICHL